MELWIGEFGEKEMKRIEGQKQVIKPTDSRF